jgi:DNA-binding MarR family transcriptional regulator
MAPAVGTDESVVLANELRPILLRLARHLRSEIRSTGITGGQMALLVAIEFNPGITAQELAKRENLSGPGVSGHLARLEGQGLIRRSRGEDRRRIGLYLTASGEALVDSVRDQRTSWLAARLSLLSPEERQSIKVSLAALDRVSLGDR